MGQFHDLGHIMDRDAKTSFSVQACYVRLIEPLLTIGRLQLNLTQVRATLDYFQPIAKGHRAAVSYRFGFNDLFRTNSLCFDYPPDALIGS